MLLNKYCIIKNAVDKDLAMFLYNYFHMKKKVYDTCRQARYISPFETMFGFYEQPGTPGAIVPHTYCSYADIALETLLEKLKPIVEKTTGLKVQPAYSFARLYKNGDVLPRHKDRFSCEISTTIYLGGDEWPIYLDPKNDKIEKSIINYKSQGNKGGRVTAEYMPQSQQHKLDVHLGGFDPNLAGPNFNKNKNVNPTVKRGNKPQYKLK